jgi:hypothetical protein
LICEISTVPFLKIKKYKAIQTCNNSIVKIYDEDIEVQLDETAICSGKIIVSPSQILEIIKGLNGLSEVLKKQL